MFDWISHRVTLHDGLERRMPRRGSAAPGGSDNSGDYSRPSKEGIQVEEISYEEFLEKMKQSSFGGLR
jgi:hypothetical protein